VALEKIRSVFFFCGSGKSAWHFTRALCSLLRDDFGNYSNDSNARYARVVYKFERQKEKRRLISFFLLELINYSSSFSDNGRETIQEAFFKKASLLILYLYKDHFFSELLE
jgi:hypothetical protein